MRCVARALFLNRNAMNGIYTFLDESRRGLRTEKAKIRRLFVSYCHEYFLNLGVNNVKFFTLPGPFWEFEKQVKDRFKRFSEKRIQTYFSCVERDNKLFNLGAIRISKHNNRLKLKECERLGGCYLVSNGKDTTLFNTDADTFFKNADRNLDCIWLDTQSPIDCLESTIKGACKMLNPGGIFALTCIKGRERIKIENRAYFLKKIMPETISIDKVWEYKDGSPMVLFICKMAFNSVP